MAQAILSRLVDPKFLVDREFIYQRAHLKERESETHFRLLKQHKQKKVYHYFQDPATKQWYFGHDHPHATKRVLAAMALGTFVLYTATTILRVMQSVIILTGVFFRTYKATFANRKKDDFPDIFFGSLKVQLFQQKKELTLIGRSVLLDARCALAMVISGVAANFCGDEHYILKMGVIFSEMEQQWNKGANFDIESGEESSWHADNAVIANWTRKLKHTNLREMGFRDFLDQLKEVRSYSNRTFYLYQCAQPLSQSFIERLTWVPGHFPSYAALLAHYKSQVQRLEKPKA